MIITLSRLQGIPPWYYTTNTTSPHTRFPAISLDCLSVRGEFTTWMRLCVTHVRSAAPSRIYWCLYFMAMLTTCFSPFLWLSWFFVKESHVSWRILHLQNYKFSPQIRLFMICCLLIVWLYIYSTGIRSHVHSAESADKAGRVYYLDLKFWGS